METIMKVKLFVAFAVMASASATAFAQDMTRDQLNSQRPQTMQERPQSVSPSARMNDSSRGGVQSGNANSGTLMQRREQGMSPGSSQAPARNNDSTGTMSQ
jgi:hypothetical protein